MGRAIELSLLAIIVIVVAFYVIPKIMLELGKIRGQKRKLPPPRNEDEE